ncbi:MAG: 50S ribosomal protein L13 [Armatimonadetes bacterium CG2_30_59_28]|nr:50S ribosomal protein L13 [Armatimonadota bacterium]OIO92514.1 MAG: 50S ribosomal protein L13 [Armatimonadetes bacterium CG2_30_59_28]PIU65747.1 MAG: 50S ribosomal protein L13 [Armatimonadetes bacterium CG07_land_8_20_14_0_80_59_28]PIX38242.1 MAG: 50S ribosomal protein L13 [Armatimonadetes bacterium CG_4_8_14_3_um_filter_58_9]PIY45118.1 MAG: 50S ribosomal protein L13 [Armatimonadetes bacterium CG_4_10_14_3_um_filter_59_10]
MKTYQPKANEADRQWVLVDAENQVLGRLASQIATVLHGKHKPQFAPHVDVGDFVIVINADKIRLTGQKLDQKIYYRHSQYPGGLREVPYRKLMATRPELALSLAVKRMLPKNSLGRKMATKLKIYRGPAHPHEAQQPKPLDVVQPASA